MEKHIIKYKTPSSAFYEALPIGNGKLGATIFGRPDYEKIVINDESLYSRYPKDENNYGANAYLPQIRRLIFEDRIKEAEAIIESPAISSCNNSAFLPLANLYLDFGHKAYQNYMRSLSLDTAVHRVEYECDGVHYLREQFASAVSGVCTLRLTASQPGAISFALSANSELRHHCHFPAPGRLRLTGRAPDESFPRHRYNEAKAARFEMLLQVLPSGGTMKTEFDRIVVQNADAVLVHLVTDTGYTDFNTPPDKDPHIFCAARLKAAIQKPHAEMLAEHIAEYTPWFQAAALDLGPDPSSEDFMEDRIAAFERGEAGNSLYALYFQFGRYVLISSSRPGNVAPANLQGIWSEDEYGDWACAYTININLPMNYWMAETTGLSALAQPLFRFIKNLSVNGEKTAKAHYDCPGWVCHHNTGIYCKTAPFTNMENATRWGMWPMAGVWLCRHLWEHYVFTLDTTFLKDFAYPILKGAAEFCKGFLCEHEGCLVSCPSTSPESAFYNEAGEVCAASYSTTMDICLMQEIFDTCSKAAELLGIDADFAAQLQSTKSRLHPILVNAEGVLQEWVEDYREATPGIAHMSPLYGLYPGNNYSKKFAPELYAAAKKQFERHYPYFQQNKGWGSAWRSCIAARLGDGEMAAKEVANAFRGSPYPMFITFMPNQGKQGKTEQKAICQIDAIMGTTAGIAEMLLQSQDGQIEILPAIPAAWRQGSFQNLRARGGITVSAEWQDEQITARLCAQTNCTLSVILGKGAPQTVNLIAGKETQVTSL